MLIFELSSIINHWQMHIKNCEFKARVFDYAPFEKRLLTLNPLFHGMDHQIDTYFNVTHGRLKLREGNIENALINYDRANIASSKMSRVILYKHTPDSALKEILTKQLGIKTVVDKMRRIYFIDHVKFHFDTVVNLGSFVEVEVIDTDDRYTIEELKQQCDYYQAFLGLTPEDMVDRSYSDLLMEEANR